MNITNFRIQIRTLMERKKVSIAKLSRMADLHPDTIYRYLREESEISASRAASSPWIRFRLGSAR